MSHLTIAIGCDHAGYTVVDFGTNSKDSVDYPDFVHPLATEVASGQIELGILICGSANGVCMTANKHREIRAALCWNVDVAKLARQHNNANIICLPARFVTIEEAQNMAEAFLTTSFEGGRHQARVDKISNC
jgi:ribose 5-phosphate isomerase B